MQADQLFLITNGEFEISKNVKFINEKGNIEGKKQFEMKEFLPQTRHKYNKTKTHFFM